MGVITNFDRFDCLCIDNNYWFVYRLAEEKKYLTEDIMSFQKVAEALSELQSQVAELEIEKLRIGELLFQSQSMLRLRDAQISSKDFIIARLRTENTMVQDA